MAIGRVLVLLSFASVLSEGMQLPTMDVMEKPIFKPASDDILIYSAPKTGTSTLQRSLGELMEPPCIVRTNGTRAAKKHDQPLAHEFLKQRAPGSHTWVISVARNPFARRMSMFFQGIYDKFGEEELPHVPLKKIHEEFHDALSKHPENNFFSDHLSFLGVNITSFDFEGKILHIEHDWEDRRLSILILRVEDIMSWGKIMSPFFPGFTVHKANIGSDKSYADVYRSFLRTFKYSQSEVDVTLRRSVVMQQFYTPKEREAFLNAARLERTDERLGRSIDFDFADDSVEYRAGDDDKFC